MKVKRNGSLVRRLFTVSEYQEMARTGILAEDERVELVEGEIVRMSPIGRRHVAVVNRLNTLLAAKLRKGVIVSVQNPIRLGRRSEPQPDIAVLRPNPGFYAEALPEPKDILLIIEVADTTLEMDRNVKLPLYAKAGAPEVWIVDLVGEIVEAYCEPYAGDYRRRIKARRGERVRSSTIAQLELRVTDILIG